MIPNVQIAIRLSVGVGGRFHWREIYLEGVAGVSVIAVTGADRCLLANQVRNLFKFGGVDVAIAVQVKHFERDFEVTARC